MLLSVGGGQALKVDLPPAATGLLSVAADIDGPIVDVVSIHGDKRLTVARGRGVVLERYTLDPSCDRYELLASATTLVEIVILPLGALC